MTDKNSIREILHHLNCESNSLNELEKQQLRDELLALLLFSDFRKSTHQTTLPPSNFRGLKKAERDLIKKLADQTDALYKMTRKDDIDND